MSIHPQLTARIPRTIIERIDAEADRRDLSRAYVVRRALEDWLSRHEGEPLSWQELQDFDAERARREHQ